MQVPSQPLPWPRRVPAARRAGSRCDRWSRHSFGLRACTVVVSCAVTMFKQGDANDRANRHPKASRALRIHQSDAPEQRGQVQPIAGNAAHNPTCFSVESDIIPEPISRTPVPAQQPFASLVPRKRVSTRGASNSTAPSARPNHPMDRAIRSLSVEQA